MQIVTIISALIYTSSSRVISLFIWAHLKSKLEKMEASQ